MPEASLHRAAALSCRSALGPTKCIGEEFGLAEATLALATISARWKLIPEPGHTVSPAARAVLCAADSAHAAVGPNNSLTRA